MGNSFKVFMICPGARSAIFDHEETSRSNHTERGLPGGALYVLDLSATTLSFGHGGAIIRARPLVDFDRSTPVAGSGSGLLEGEAMDRVRERPCAGEGTASSSSPNGANGDTAVL